MNLVVNANHPMIYKLHEEKEEKVGEKVKEYKKEMDELNSKLKELDKDDKSRKEHESEIEQLRNDISDKENKRDEVLKEFGKDHNIVKQLIDLGLLSQNMLKGESLNTFIKRSYDLIDY
jgi:molecular chaperone HtpG